LVPAILKLFHEGRAEPEVAHRLSYERHHLSMAQAPVFEQRICKLLRLAVSFDQQREGLTTDRPQSGSSRAWDRASDYSGGAKRAR
jgi:hypothetical protein